MSIDKFFKNSSVYSLGSIFVIAFSLLSFPITTRYLSVEDYGIINIVGAVTGLLIAIGKMGTSKSIMRFFTNETREPNSQKAYYSTVIAGVGLSSLVVMFVVLSLIYFISYFKTDWADEKVLIIAIVGAFSVFSASLYSSILNLLKASEQAIRQTTIQVTTKMITSVSVIIVLVFVSQTAIAMLAAMLLVELIIVCIVVFYVFGKERVAFKCYNKDLHWKMIVFGAPLIGWEMSAQVLSFTDKYMLTYILGIEAVAHYSAPYNLASFIYTGLFLAIAGAATPIATRIWETKGEVETREFLYRSSTYYIAVGGIVIVMFSIIGEDLLKILTGGKYNADSVFLFVLVFSFFVKGLSDISVFSLYIQKKAPLMLKLMLVSVLVNMVLCFVLIPKWGVLGAAVGTLISNLVLLCLIYWNARNMKIFRLPYETTVVVVFACSLVVFVVSNVSASLWYVQMISQVVLGVLIYFAVLFSLEKKIRQELLVFIRKSRSGNT